MDEQNLAGLRETARRLQANLDSSAPSVSREIVWAYQDSAVRNAIATRLAKGETLISRHVLVPDIVLRLHRVYFSFSPPHGHDETHPGVLVQLHDDSQVYEIVDPAELDHRRIKETVVDSGAFPLVFSRPLLVEGRRSDRTLDQFEDFVKREGLEAAFARRLRGLSAGGTVGGLGGVFADFTSGTCVETYNDIPVIKNPGTPTTVHSLDVDYVEDDSNAF